MTSSVTTSDLSSIGLRFDRWQDAVEAAIATGQLQVIGKVRGGQLVQYNDASGAQITILAVEPFATFAGFESVTQAYANIDMVTDVLALCEVTDPFGAPMATVALNLAQGPLLAEDGQQQFQPVALTALVVEHQLYASAVQYENATGGMAVGEFSSPGADLIAAGSGAAAPDATARFSARILDAEYRHNQLTGQRFIHATVDGAFPFDICLPDSPELPPRDAVIEATAVMTGNILAEVGGGGCGCGGSCGCGGH